MTRCSTQLKRAHSLIPSKWKVLIFVAIIMLMNLHNVAKGTTKASKDIKLKYILLWTVNDTEPARYWLSGQQKFIAEHCAVSDCYITSDRTFLGNSVTNFDAIIFQGRNLEDTMTSELPRKRSSHQKYIYVNTESADNEPICTSKFNGFFNWTATYRLDSDIVINYLEILNAAGEVVGPRKNMTWLAKMSDVNDTLLGTLKRKTKTAAWFVSDCHTRSKREKYAENLKQALIGMHRLTLDIYGRCGNLYCPRTESVRCNNMLRNDYFFYLSFENSFSIDYITEKALTPLVYGAVPVVYGGADYSRFLPPGSYIDARRYSPEELAFHMASIISDPAAYQKFFKWRNHYSFREPAVICRLCAALHDQRKFKARAVYRDFRAWWVPYHQERCKQKKWTFDMEI